MAGVNEVKLTDEEKRSARSTQHEKEKAFAQELVEGLDLPAGVRREVDRVADAQQDEEDENEDERSGEEGEDGSEEESSGEEGSEEEASVEDEEGSEDESSEEGEEDDPKTIAAMQKRIDELTAKNKRLEAQAKSKESSSEGEDEVEDVESRKLSKMSVSDLKALKSEVKLAWKEEKDPKEARKLLQLEDKIDAAISEAPRRFEASQLSAYRSAVATTAEELGAKFTKDAQQAIFKRAGEIFASRPSLQSSVDGQAMAWQLAAEIYVEKSKVSAAKTTTDELRRENNKLKKKTSLDVAVRKGNTKTSENERLFQKAKSGTPKDKLAFFKNELRTDDLIPENLRSR